ncbi:MAG: helix-turn-helix domain-containing protein [Flavobacteriaceae bacterium]|nr:MAG: helix-turn-helix domain-containing protein [Flavobacteriaceae bacterium]
MTNKDQFEVLVKLDLNQFAIKLLEKMAEQMPSTTKQKEFITKKECMDILGIKSSTTLQKLRDLGAFEYTKVGGIYLYKYSSIMEYLEENKQAKF